MRVIRDADYTAVRENGSISARTATNAVTQEIPNTYHDDAQIQGLFCFTSSQCPENRVPSQAASPSVATKHFPEPASQPKHRNPRIQRTHGFPAPLTGERQGVNSPSPRAP